MEELYSDVYNNALNNSVNTEERKITRQQYRKGRQKAYIKGLKKGFIAGAIASVIVVTSVGLGGKAIVNAVDANNYPYEFIQDGYESVGASSYMLPLQPGDSQFNHAYHHEVIVDAISKGDFDSELYGAYRGMVVDGIGMSTVLDNMDTVVRLCNYEDLTECTSFVQYCELNGFVTKDGKIDTKAYENAMKQYLNQREELKEAQENMTTMRH